MSSCSGSGGGGSTTATGTGRAPVLVVALGNTLAGDDGVAVSILGRLRSRIPQDDVELLEGGSDLLRLEPELRGRRSILLIDALLDDGPPGRLVCLDDLEVLDESGGAHNLSPARAVRLLRLLHPDVRAAAVTLLGVTVTAVAAGPGLSPALADRLDALVEQVMERISAVRPHHPRRRSGREADVGRRLTLPTPDRCSRSPRSTPR